MDILDILLDILLKPRQPFIGLFFNVSRCQGCPEKINSTMPPPHDIFFPDESDTSLPE